MVRSNLFSLLQQVEKKNNKKYSWASIGRYIKRSRQATENLFMGELSGDSFIKYDTMAGLLHFFRSEGLDIGPGDLFIEIPSDDLLTVKAAATTTDSPQQ